MLSALDVPSEPHVLVGEMDLCCFVDSCYHLFSWWLVAAFQRKLPEVWSHGEQTLWPQYIEIHFTSLCSTNVYAHRLNYTKYQSFSSYLLCLLPYASSFSAQVTLFYSSLSSRYLVQMMPTCHSGWEMYPTLDSMSLVPFTNNNKKVYKHRNMTMP